LRDLEVSGGAGGRMMRVTGGWGYKVVMIVRTVLIAAVVVLWWPEPALANDFFVITDTFKSQQDAQDRAAAVGGWALDTDAYSGLEPERFAVVRGPYASAQVATKSLEQLKKIKTYRSAYVKDAGTLRLPANLTESVSPKVLAALLGELSITVKDMPGGGNPCEPDEPYQAVSVSVVTLDRTGSRDSEKEGFKPRRVRLDIGAVRVIKRTGEISRMRLCAE
jgi:hypothetical protein